MGSAYHVWNGFKGEIGWGMYVRYLCVVFVRGMCACGLGQVWVDFRGFGGERAVREPEKTGDTGGVRVCGTRAVTGSERGSRGVWRFQREFGGTGGGYRRGKGGKWRGEGCGGSWRG